MTLRLKSGAGTSQSIHTSSSRILMLTLPVWLLFPKIIFLIPKDRHAVSDTVEVQLKWTIFLSSLITVEIVHFRNNLFNFRLAKSAL